MSFETTHRIGRRVFLGGLAAGALTAVAPVANTASAAVRRAAGAGARPSLADPQLGPRENGPRFDDWRLLENGRVIPSLNYADQPYLVKADDGAWVCVLTTGAGLEGAAGQHVTITRSTDQGRTWSAPLALEPPDGPEASYAVLLKAPAGRIYCFYNHNTDNLRWVRGDNPPYRDGRCTRVDTQGHFVFKFSDDHGKTWSRERYEIPVREFEIDRKNPYGGKVRYFWNVGRPFMLSGAAYVPLIKVGGFGAGFMTHSEGVLLRSANLAAEQDPRRATWETLPEGEAGLRAPQGGGPIAEEQSYVTLSDGSLYVTYRTVDGHPACSYSRDGGRTWSEPRYASYADGRPIRHPRAANFAWKCANGKFLYWFHNHGGKSYDDRNPAWICGGVEADSPEGKVIHWSQPEVLLYGDDIFQRMSYPDLIEDGGRYFVTETEKQVARVHEIPRALVEGLWGQFEPGRVARAGLLMEWARGAGAAPTVALKLPRLPELLVSARPHAREVMTRKGFSLEFRLRLESLDAGQTIMDSQGPDGAGVRVRTGERGTVEIELSDGRTRCAWDCDEGLLKAGRWHQVVVTVDGGPHLITFVVDGVLCDGGGRRQFGWGRFSPQLRHASGGDEVKLGEGMKGEISVVRVYGRALTTSEAVVNWKADAGMIIKIEP